MKKNTKNHKTNALIANLLADNDPAGSDGRLKILIQLVSTKKQLLADVAECRKSMIWAFTLDEQAHYRRKTKKRQQQADDVERLLRYLSKFAVDEKVAAAATAELL